MRWILDREELDCLYSFHSGKPQEGREADSLLAKGLLTEEDCVRGLSLAGEMVLDILQGETANEGFQMEVSLVEEEIRVPKPKAKTIEDFF